MFIIFSEYNNKENRLKGEKLSFKIKIKLNKNENTIWKAFAFVGCKLILQLKLMTYISFKKFSRYGKRLP